MRIERPIALVGLPGAGKSFLGARLAGRLVLPFADVDGEVEATAGLTIPALFEAEGEAGFRERERALIAKLLDGPPRVLALGGGALEDEAMRAALFVRAIVIWLDAPDDVLAGRIGGGEGRPLFAGGDVPEVLRRLRQRRQGHFAQAHHRVETDAADVLERLVRLLR